MRAAIYNPYLDTLGGGERYTLAFAKALGNSGYKVDVQWKDKKIKKKIEKRFGISLAGVNLIQDVKGGDGYDVCFWLSDGSIPLLRARKNILHFQIPFKDVGGSSLINRMKLYRMEEVVCNSYFTKSYIDKEYSVDSAVIYPPVDVGKFKPKRKGNSILFVGRFSQLKQQKRHDILIRVFKNMIGEGLEDWRLILAGGTEVGGGRYLDDLKEKSKGFPIEIIESPSFDSLKELYGKSKIFWSAAGYGVDAERSPEQMEHFGITVVEAMVAKAVPIVFDGGGHKEIIADGVNGFLWKGQSQLKEKTLELINKQSILRRTAKRAREDSYVYEYERFESQVKEIL